MEGSGVHGKELEESAKAFSGRKNLKPLGAS